MAIALLTKRSPLTAQGEQSSAVEEGRSRRWRRRGRKGVQT